MICLVVVLYRVGHLVAGHSLLTPQNKRPILNLNSYCNVNKSLTLIRWTTNSFRVAHERKATSAQQIPKNRCFAFSSLVKKEEEESRPSSALSVVEFSLSLEDSSETFHSTLNKDNNTVDPCCEVCDALKLEGVGDRFGHISENSRQILLIYMYLILKHFSFPFFCS